MLCLLKPVQAHALYTLVHTHTYIPHEHPLIMGNRGGGTLTSVTLSFSFKLYLMYRNIISILINNIMGLFALCFKYKNIR